MQSTMLKSIHHSISTLACLALAGTLAACGGGGGGGGGGGDGDGGTTTGTDKPAITFAKTSTEDRTRTYAGASGGTFTNVATATANGKCTTPPGPSYSSSDVTNASVDTSGVVTYKAAGSYTITASTVATAGCAAADATYDLTVNKATADLTFDSSITRSVATGGGTVQNPVTLGNTTADPTTTAAMGGTIRYSSDNTSIATVDATTGKVTYSTSLDVASVVIYASYSGSDNYRDITGDNRASYTLHISNSTPTLVFAIATADATYAGANPVAPAGTYTRAASVSPSGLCTTTPGITYSSDNTANAPVNTLGEVTYKAATPAGSPYTITASTAATAGCAQADVTYDLTVNKATPTLVFTSDSVDVATGASVRKLVSLYGAGDDSTSDGRLDNVTVTYSSDETSIATVDANSGEVTAALLDGTADVTINASYAGSHNYTDATAGYTLIISNNAPTITFAKTSTEDLTQTYAGASPGGKFTNAATVATKGKCTVLPTPTYSISPVNDTKATVNQDTGEVTYKAAGSYTITAATQAETSGDSVCAAASKSYILTVNQADADFTFDSSITRRVGIKGGTALYLGSVRGIPSDTSAGVDIGGAISYSSADPSKASVDTSTGVVTGGDNTGEVRITATYSGSKNYKDTAAGYTLKISNNVPKSISFTSAEVTADYAGAIGRTYIPQTADVSVDKVNSLCQTPPGVTYTISDGTNASVDVSGAGTYIITATTEEERSGDIVVCHPISSAYILTVNKATATLTFDNPPTQVATGASVSVPARLEGVGSDSSTDMGGTISYSSDNTSGASVDANGTVTAGSDAISNVTITASYNGSNNYTNATASYTFSIAQLAVNGSPIKKLIFTWQDVADATHYKLWKIHGGGLNTQVGDVSASNTGGVQSITHIVPLYASADTQYMLESCGDTSCTSSTNSLPITQAQLNRAIGYIKASNTDGSDEFGYSLSLSADGTTLAVGARYEDSNATDIGGDQSNDNSGNSGAVYVFTRDATTDNWSQQAYIKASNTDVSDEFGQSVSLSADGTTLAVGAYKEGSDATGVYNDQTQWSTAVVGGNNNTGNAGAVYVFTRPNNTSDEWSQQAYIKASNTGGEDWFGWSVSLDASGTTLAVGANREASDATGVYNNKTQWSTAEVVGNDNTSNAGAVYVFTRPGSTSSDWTQQAYIKASNTGVDDYFGHSLSLSADGTTLAVVAPYEDSSADGVGGRQDGGARDSGAVYVFSRNATTNNWSQQAYIKASNTDSGDSFGWSVSLDASGTTLAVGANREASNATGVYNNQTQWSTAVVSGNHSASNAGAVYVFTRPGSTSRDWTQDAYIKASNTGDDDYFGHSLSLDASGTTLAVVAPYEDSSADGVGGRQDGGARDSGAVYVFSRNATTNIWSQQAYIKASNTGEKDEFGYSVSLNAAGTTLAVGARLEQSNATGIGGNQSDNSADKAGAVYLY